LRLCGAWLEGSLNLNGANVERHLLLWRCHIDRIEAFQANLKSVNLSEFQLVGGIAGDLLRCDGGLMLRNGRALGGVSFANASINGSVDFRGSFFEGGDYNVTLSLTGAAISDSIFLDNGFRSVGHIQLDGATIGRNLNGSGGGFEAKWDYPLSCVDMAVHGSALFRETICLGGIRLSAATIGGDLDFRGADLLSRSDLVLSCDRSRVEGWFFFNQLKKLTGGIDLSSMTVGSLDDDEASWQGAKSAVILDGFTYGRFAGEAPTDARMRVAWLDLQSNRDLKGRFRPQPWEQVIATFRSMGYSDEAREVAVAKHERMQKAGRFVGGSRLWDRTYGMLVGYGYRPWKLLRSVLIVWLFCTLAYWAAVNPQWFGSETHLLAPMKSEPNLPCLLARATNPNAQPCPPKEVRYENFFVPAFSAEVLLPVVTLGYKGEWRPVVSTPDGRQLFWGWALQFLYWFEIFFGWVAGLLLVAAVGTLIKRD